MTMGYIGGWDENASNYSLLNIFFKEDAFSLKNAYFCPFYKPLILYPLVAIYYETKIVEL